jgi:tight adherence protein B
MRRALLLLALSGLLAVALAASVAAAGGRQITVSPVARLHFPERGFLVDLPTNRNLTSTDIVVRENGQIVPNVSLVPAASSSQTFATMLVIDASDSMRGAPLKDALEAARRFANQLGAGQRVGVLTFNNRWSLVQKPTEDSTQLSSALATAPKTGQGTHIYDALAEALLVLQASHVSAGSIVLLSDGADTGSGTHETQLATRAHRMRVRIFTVGLHSSSFRPGPLRSLALDTGANYAEASSPAQLGSIYEQIGKRLASEYLLRYRSDANPGSNVVVLMNIQGVGSSTALYSVPKVVNVPPFKRSLLQRFWTSAFSLLVMALLVAAFAAVGVWALVRRPTSTIAARVAEFATLPSTSTEEPEQPKRFSDRLFGGTERSLSRTSWWGRFKEELEIANIKYSAEQILGMAILGTLLLGLLLSLWSPVFSIFALAFPLVVRGSCRTALRRVRGAFEEQLPDNLQVLASALRAGHSLVGALSVVATDALEPSKREFTRVVADEQLGVPLEDSLREVARRMDNRDLEQVALVGELQRQSGGNMAEVLDRVVETVRARFDLRRLVKTLTAQGRLARWILSALPLVLIGLISLVNPGYETPLFSSTGGQAVVVFAGLMVIAGSLAIKKIVDIKV